MVALAAAVLAVAAPSHAQAPSGPTPTKPDLVADPVEGPYTQAYAGSGADPQLLLRFDGFVHNAGAAPFRIEASTSRATTEPGALAEMTSVVQRLGDGSPLPLPAARVYFEPADGHNHWHLRNAARYSLVDTAGALVAPAAKVGFCLLDSLQVSGDAPQSPEYASQCGRHRPDATAMTMELSPGWRDIYESTLAFQWVDVSDTQPGEYRLRSEMDPDGLFAESDEDNVPGEAPAVVPGYRARAATVDGLQRGQTAAVPLGADLFGTNLGTREVRIDEAPRFGAIDAPIGAWVRADAVRYTPALDAPAADTLRFSARDASSPFPRSPASASVALVIAGEAARVAISGAPAELVAGTSVQLVAAAGGPGAGDVSWSVDGVPGGDTRVGTVTPGGLFRAPAVPPPGERVTVLARTAGGAQAAATIRIVPAPARVAAPLPAVAPKRPVSRLRVVAARIGGVVAVTARPAVDGRLRLTLVARGRRLDTCLLRVRARRSYGCRLRPRGRHGARLVVATLLPRGGRAFSRSVTVTRARGG